MTAFTIEPYRAEHRAGCADVLAALPHWFGFPDVNQGHIDSLDRLPAFVAVAGDAVLGFIALDQTSASAVEIDVLAVRPELHRQDVGRALISRAEEHLRAEGAPLLHLKTLGPSHPDEGYAKTREFYAALGFLPLLETTALWGKEQPCLVLVKYVAASSPFQG